jgi:hypothetical protein
VRLWITGTRLGDRVYQSIGAAIVHAELAVGRLRGPVTDRVMLARFIPAAAGHGISRTRAARLLRAPGRGPKGYAEAAHVSVVRLVW